VESRPHQTGDRCDVVLLDGSEEQPDVRGIGVLHDSAKGRGSVTASASGEIHDEREAHRRSINDIRDDGVLPVRAVPSRVAVVRLAVDERDRSTELVQGQPHPATGYVLAPELVPDRQSEQGRLAPDPVTSSQAALRLEVVEPRLDALDVLGCEVHQPDSVHGVNSTPPWACTSTPGRSRDGQRLGPSGALPQRVMVASTSRRKALPYVAA